jgi:crotonobetaine/carnitine-CoA ligase
VPRQETVFGAFEAAAAAFPERGALCAPAMPGRPYAPDGVELIYAEASERVERLRRRYAASGLGVGHRVALLLENRPEFHLHWFALNALGVSIVPVNPAYRDDELSYLFEHSEAELLVSVPDRVDGLVAIARARRKPLPVIDAAALPARLPSPSSPARGHVARPRDEAALLYTSGTTGRPKGCQLSNAYFIQAGRWYIEAGGAMTMQPGCERLINPLPLYHANALAISSMAMLMSGGCIIMPDRFHPRSWWRDVAATEATIIHYLGVMPPLLLGLAQAPEERLHRVKFGAGAGVDPVHHRAFEERFGFPLVEGWGMTEVAMPAWASREPREIATRAFGRPLSGVEFRVVNEDDAEVSVGTFGELVLRSAGPDRRALQFSGYLKDEAATAAAWRGGWFHTGDVVTRSADGMHYFVDRKKNIIRRSGENIAAAEVEAVLQAHEDVAQAAVIAVPDELREEEVFACIVPAAGKSPTAEALQDWCFARIAYYKAPGFVLFVDSLPTTGTQKVHKIRLFPAGHDPRAERHCVDLRHRKKRL